MRVKIEKCHNAIEENGASTNKPRVYIEDKSRHMQSSRERDDMSVENKFKESWVGPQAKMSFDMWLENKSVDIQYKNFPNLVSNGYSTNYA